LPDEGDRDPAPLGVRVAGFEELPPRVGPTVSRDDFFQLQDRVVPRVGVHLEDAPVSFEESLGPLLLARLGELVDDLPVEQCREFETNLYKFVENARPGMLAGIREKKSLDDDLKKQLNDTLKEFKDRFQAGDKKPVAAKPERNGRQGKQVTGKEQQPEVDREAETLKSSV